MYMCTDMCNVYMYTDSYTQKVAHIRMYVRLHARFSTVHLLGTGNYIRTYGYIHIYMYALYTAYIRAC